jgi:hypothetical protein
MPNYQLDYIYFSDELGGKPVVYASKPGATPFQSSEEFLKFYGEELSGERSYGIVQHAYDYLDKIRIDQSPESYFQFITLALSGDQFYLFWHGLYNDTKILCDRAIFNTLKQISKTSILHCPRKWSTDWAALTSRQWSWWARTRSRSVS